MTTLMQLITEATRIFFEIIPRFIKISANQGGVKFGLGDSVKILKPGVYFYIPLTQKIQVVNTAIRSINLKKQTLMSKDLQNVFVESSCRFKIVDINTAIVKNHNVSYVIEDIILSKIREAVIKNNFSDILTKTDIIRGNILDMRDEIAAQTGVEIISIRITDLAKCIHFNKIENITYGKLGLD